MSEFKENYVNFEKVTIRSIGSSSDGIDLRAFITNINVYESIHSTSVTAEISISDGNDLYTQLPIIGEEEITIEFTTPGRDETNSYIFLVNEISNLTINTQGTRRLYTLKCVSKEFLLNMCSLYSKRYDTPYHTAVQDILSSNLNTEKDIDVEPSKGIFDMMVNNKRPFQVIDLIKMRAVSANHEKSSYMFYEDKNGYHFISIEKLIEDRKAAIGDKQFFYNQNKNASIDTDNIRSILMLVTDTSSNNIRNISQAGLKSETRVIDILTGNIEKATYEYSEEYVKTDDAVKSHSSEYLDMFGKKPSKKFFMIKDGTRKENYHNSNMAKKIGYNTRLSNIKSRMRTYGDTDIVPGDVITLHMIEVSGSDTEARQNRPSSIITGNYLIESLKRNFNQTIRGFEHYMDMTISKTDFSIED